MQRQLNEKWAQCRLQFDRFKFERLTAVKNSVKTNVQLMRRILIKRDTIIRTAFRHIT